jgi:hypothetical protein
MATSSTRSSSKNSDTSSAASATRKYSTKKAAVKKVTAKKSAMKKPAAKKVVAKKVPAQISVSNDAHSGERPTRSSAVFGAHGVRKGPFSITEFDRLDAVLDDTLNQMCGLLGVAHLGDDDDLDADGRAAASPSDDADHFVAEGFSNAGASRAESHQEENAEDDLDINEDKAFLFAWNEMKTEVHERVEAMHDTALDFIDSLTEETDRQSSDKVGRQALADWGMLFGALALGRIVFSLVFRRR